MHPNSSHSLHLTSRRNFLRTTAATLAAGAVGSGFVPQALAEKTTNLAPNPIPGGTPSLGGAFHVYAPGPAGVGLDPPDSEPATITDFKGFAGLAYISGTCVRTDRKTGMSTQLPFVGADMRFMQGVYRGVDDRVHQGTFGLI